MKRPLATLSGAALLMLTSAPAWAACADELAKLMPGTTTGSVTAGAAASAEPNRVSKDGSLAPLQTQQSGSAQTTGSAQQGGAQADARGGLSKDGSTMPLANQPGGGSAQVATSGQDAQSQQRSGGATVSAAPANRSPAMMASLDRARTLQQRGDEAGCMAAIEEARRQ